MISRENEQRTVPAVSFGPGFESWRADHPPEIITLSIKMKLDIYILDQYRINQIHTNRVLFADHIARLDIRIHIVVHAAFSKIHHAEKYTTRIT